MKRTVKHNVLCPACTKDCVWLGKPEKAAECWSFNRKPINMTWGAYVYSSLGYMALGALILFLIQTWR